jgi:hypothetical protein
VTRGTQVQDPVTNVVTMSMPHKTVFYNFPKYYLAYEISKAAAKVMVINIVLSFWIYSLSLVGLYLAPRHMLDK